MLLSIGPSDAQIHHDVLQELARERRVAEMDVGVDVCDGVVRLMGIVTSYVAK
jgi:osmotically-inducible protein OsmY